MRCVPAALAAALATPGVAADPAVTLDGGLLICGAAPGEVNDIRRDDRPRAVHLARAGARVVPRRRG